MDIDLIIRVATAIVVVVGPVLGLFQLLNTRRSHRYQNSKIEMELLSQGIAAQEGDSTYKSFLLDVRKEKTSFLVFGIPIPNADLERAIAYYRKAEGRVTTGDIAKAWEYRNTGSKPLSFRLRTSSWIIYVFALVYVGFCVLAFAAGAFVALAFRILTKEIILLVSVSIAGFVSILWANQGLFTAAYLAKLEKKTSKDDELALPPHGSSGE